MRLSAIYALQKSALVILVKLVQHIGVNQSQASLVIRLYRSPPLNRIVALLCARTVFAFSLMLRAY